MIDRKGKLTYGYLDTPFKCDICGKPRAHGNHQRCSKRRQAEALALQPRK